MPNIHNIHIVSILSAFDSLILHVSNIVGSKLISLKVLVLHHGQSDFMINQFIQLSDVRKRFCQL
jgi:choline-glycine betaine transporter